jgi:hypothetical protein
MIPPSKIKYGSVIYLQHVSTGTFLKSLPKPYRHPGTSGQQMVVASLEKIEQTCWLVKGPHRLGNNYPIGEEVNNGSIVRLEHCLTCTNLHSHGDRLSPLTKQQEVTCIGTNGSCDENDDWIIQIPGGGAWCFGQHIKLIHVNTSKALHSHGGQSHPVFTDGEQEVTGFQERDDNDLWCAEPPGQPSPNERTKRTSLSKDMPISDNALQSARDPNHIVWEVYDLRRTARLNLKYYQRLGEKLAAYIFWIELALAIAAPSSAVAGLIFWKTDTGKLVWGILGAVAAVLSVAKPLLHLTDKIQNATEIHSAYAALEHDLDKLSAQIRHKKDYDQELQNQFLELIDKKGKIVAINDRNKQNRNLKKLCEAEVEGELPAEKFYIPPQ